ncbi:hypothetical protein GINT2_000055 [Glugoides intestinalis]
MQNVISVCNKNNLISICVFDGTRYSLFRSFYDTFSLSKTTEILDAHATCKIITSLSSVFLISLKRQYRDNIEQIEFTDQKKVFKRLSNLENSTIKVLSAFMRHRPLLNSENALIIGYAGIFKIDYIGPMGFYIGAEIVEHMNRFPLLNTIYKGATIKAGRYTIIKWLSHPLTSIEDLDKKRQCVLYVAPQLPKLRSLLKNIHINALDKKLEPNRLKKTLKAVFLMQKLLKKCLSLQSKKKYMKIYKIICIFGKEGILPGADSKLDSLRGKMNSLHISLENVANKVSKKHNVAVSAVYLPGLGFFIESYTILYEPFFIINDKYYFKTEEVNNLDHILGDPYQLLVDRESYIISKVIEKIQKTNFSHLYDFIGEVDAYCSLYQNTAGLFTETLLECNSFVFSGVELCKKSIFLGNYEMEKLIECVVINQIGGRTIIEKLPFFDHIAMKIPDINRPRLFDSTFQDEMIQLAAIFQFSTQRTLCLFKEIGESTTPKEGLVILSAIIKKVPSFFSIFSTTFDYSELELYIAQVDRKIYKIKNEKYVEINEKDEKEMLEDELEALNPVFKEYLLLNIQKNT